MPEGSGRKERWYEVGSSEKGPASWLVAEAES